MAGRLDGKIALITGAGSGMGRAAALVFAREGAKVVAADIVEDAVAQTVEMVKVAGGEAIFVTDVSQGRAGFSRNSGAGGQPLASRLDCAFNNAGIEGDFAPLAEISEQTVQRLLAVNLLGAWLCMKYEIKQMLAQGVGGAIVNTASVSGLMGTPMLGMYSATKAGVLLAARTAAMEYGKYGIRVNCVCPGMIMTPMLQRAIGHLSARSNPRTDATVRYTRGDRGGRGLAVLRCRLVCDRRSTSGGWRADRLAPLRQKTVSRAAFPLPTIQGRRLVLVISGLVPPMQD